MNNLKLLAHVDVDRRWNTTADGFISCIRLIYFVVLKGSIMAHKSHGIHVLCPVDYNIDNNCLHEG